MKRLQKIAVEITPLYFFDEMIDWLPEAEFPVSRSIGVPTGQWLHPALQPGSLGNVSCERWCRHDLQLLTLLY